PCPLSRTVPCGANRLALRVPPTRSPATLSVVPGCVLKMPEASTFTAPLARASVPDSTCTLPVLLNPTPIVLVPVPADFLNVPWLTKVPGPVMPLSDWKSQVPVLVICAPLATPRPTLPPPLCVAVAALLRERRSSVLKPVLLSASPPLATV